MEFSAAASTWMIATPVGCSDRATRPVATCACSSWASATCACESRPTAPMNSVAAPASCAASAWFAPLPPGESW